MTGIVETIAAIPLFTSGTAVAAAPLSAAAAAATPLTALPALSAATTGVTTIGSLAGSIGSTIGAVAPFAAVAGSLASAGLQVSGARQQSQALMMQADQQQRLGDQQLAATRQEMLRGQESANQVREALLRTLAAQRTQFAAAGLAIDDGTPADVAAETRRQADRELTIQAGDSAARAAASATTAQGYRGGAALLRDRAGTSLTAGGISAGISLFDAADRFTRRAPGRLT